MKVGRPEGPQPTPPAAEAVPNAELSREQRQRRIAELKASIEADKAQLRELLPLVAVSKNPRMQALVAELRAEIDESVVPAAGSLEPVTPAASPAPVPVESPPPAALAPEAASPTPALSADPFELPTRTPRPPTPTGTESSERSRFQILLAQALDPGIDDSLQPELLQAAFNDLSPEAKPTPDAKEFEWLVDASAWLEQWSGKLRVLSGADLDGKVKIIHQYLDYFLTTPPKFHDARQLIGADAQLALEQLIARQQAGLTEYLKQQGIARIDAGPGTETITGVIEINPSAEPVPTNDPNLHNRVARIAPGDGGFRHGKEVLVWARATLYRYVGSEGTTDPDAATEPTEQLIREVVDKLRRAQALGDQLEQKP